MQRGKVTVLSEYQDPDTVYVKKDGVYQPIGKLVDVDHLNYGTWIIVIKNGSKSIKRYIEGIPDIAELVIYRYEDQIMNALDTWIEMRQKSMFDLIGLILTEIRTALAKGKNA